MPDRYQDSSILFVPSYISWEAQYDHGVRMVNRGDYVEIHEHSASETCPTSGTPNGRIVRCGELTKRDGAVTLVPASETQQVNN